MYKSSTILGILFLFLVGCQKAKPESTSPKPKEDKVIIKKKEVIKPVGAEPVEYEDPSEYDEEPKPKLDSFDITRLQSDYESCLDYNCEKQLYEKWNTTFAIIYRNTLKTVGSEELKALKKAQIHWSNYKRAEGAFITMLLDKEENIWLTKSRVMEMRAYDLIIEKYGDGVNDYPLIKERIIAKYGEHLDFKDCYSNRSNL
jgi:uncharacterized protein YecT (DUF1311 family)